MAKMAEETSHRDYRDRARQEYEERRAEGRLGVFRHPLVTRSSLTPWCFLPQALHNVPVSL